VVDDELIIRDEDTARTSFLAVQRRVAARPSWWPARRPACALTEAVLPWELLRTGHPGGKPALIA